MEHSAGIVIFRESKGNREYLVLHYPGGHFDFPKGHLEHGETEKMAAVRELEEETGINKITWIEGYKHRIEYEFKRRGVPTPKDVIFFLAKTNQKKITISHEHQDSMWLPYDEAYELLTFDNAKNLLEKAEKHLNR